MNYLHLHSLGEFTDTRLPLGNRHFRTLTVTVLQLQSAGEVAAMRTLPGNMHSVPVKEQEHAWPRCKDKSLPSGN